MINLQAIIGIMGRVFANGLGNQDSIPGWVIPKTQKMVLNSSLLNTWHYKLRIKSGAIQGKQEHLLLHLGAVAIEKELLGHPTYLYGFK